MGIADLFRPKYRHSNVAVRTEAVRALTADDAVILAQIARTDADIGVRRLAIERIAEPQVLAAIAEAETERGLRSYAGERAAELWQSVACDDDVEAAGAALTGIMALDDQRSIAAVAARAALPAIRKRAFGELRDARALAELARGDAPPELRLAAVSRIDDSDVLRALAIDATQKEVGLAAVDKLEDPDRLENVAHKAKNKAVRQRARKTLVEMADAERATKPVVADDVKRRRAERAQLLRQVEALVETFEFERYAPAIANATQAWQELGGITDDGYVEADGRFTRCVERFWKRKEIHELQLRAAEEARAAARKSLKIDGEVREPSAATATGSGAPQPVESQAPMNGAARDGEAVRVRQQQQAEREARKQANAERAAAVAASISAMCDDLEALASSDKRTMERALQQAAKSFEQIGSVVGDARTALADRYAKARGAVAARLGELREADDWARFQNVPKAEALITTGRQMAAEPGSADLANRLRVLQALWKEVGPMPQRRSKELWQQFKQVCDQIYENVKSHRAVEGEKFAEITAVKEALIANAEALVESTDWAVTSDKLKALQHQWKNSGHLPRKQGDPLWKRFRAACDAFFERRKPVFEARRAEEMENLAAKQALVERAQQIARDAPGESGWGRAIAQIKDLQREWKAIGFVPRLHVDAVYAAFRTACDELFSKRDAARDAEANRYRDEGEAIAVEIAAIESRAAEDVGCVERALAVRTNVLASERYELVSSLDQMCRAVIAAHPDAVRGTELDPRALRSRREKLIGKVEELLPKPPGDENATEGSSQDVAAQLMHAMRANAFGNLRFSGRDPVEVVDELRNQWRVSGPFFEEDQAQSQRFEAGCTRVMEMFHRPDDQSESLQRNSSGRNRRRRRDRQSEEPAAARSDSASATPRLAHDAPTARTTGPLQPIQPPPLPDGFEAPSETRPRTDSMPPLPMDELDHGWDLAAEDPSAVAAENPPSSSEMAGDGARGGDGIDEPGWD
jgi:hypothetical protein